jgi:hypothetical protein
MSGTGSGAPTADMTGEGNPNRCASRIVIQAR